jgi:uncharacterized repeat protein (TIGR03803 family)
MATIISAPHSGWIWRTGLALMFLLASAIVPTQAQAQKFKVLYSFKEPPDGQLPYASMVRDAKGNLYSTTRSGGGYNCTFGTQQAGCGTVFKLDSAGNETVLYSFVGSDEGFTPVGGLTRDAAGNLYGTTYYGGTGYCSDDSFDDGCGTVFKLDTAGQETVLHSFGNSPDGANPYAALIRDGSGNLYGTTMYGGTYGLGTVFKVTPSGQETVLYSFKGGSDGGVPYAGLVRDKRGNLYGTAVLGGTYSLGTVFKLDPAGKETTLHSFKGVPDGQSPVGSLILDSEGNLYGTTNNGGTGGPCSQPNDGCGTVFEVMSTGKERVLYSFKGVSKHDGSSPEAKLVRDAAGNIYGTTVGGGATCGPGGCGTVFMLNNAGKETIFHNFTNGDDGGYPIGGPVLDAKGNLYGTTSSGGSTECEGGCGVVFKITP